MSFNQGRKMKENEEVKPRPTPIAMVAPELKQSEADTEITKTCAVLGCDESKTLNSDSFFKFPEDANLRQIWADLTGRNNWTPTDYSYICVQHFSVDCFECNSENVVVLIDKAVPSLKLPNHVLEVEYIEEDTFDNEDSDNEMEYEALEDEVDMSSNTFNSVLTNGISEGSITEEDLSKGTVSFSKGDSNASGDNIEVLKLFSEVQRMQKQAVALKEKLRSNMKIYNRQNRLLSRVKEIIEIKKNMVAQKQKKKSRILLSLQDKIQGDTNGLVLALPTRHTDDLKNFALTVYKYSPQSYIYVRNTLRTLLPSTDVLDNWVTAGYEPKNVLTKNNCVKVMSEVTESDISCKISLH